RARPRLRGRRAEALRRLGSLRQAPLDRAQLRGTRLGPPQGPVAAPRPAHVPSRALPVGSAVAMAQVIPDERELRRVIGDGESLPDGEVEGLGESDLIELYRGMVRLRTYDERSLVYH